MSDKKHIFIIEDQEANAIILANEIELSNRYKCSSTETYKGALARLEKFNPSSPIDLIILDYQLKDGTAANFMAGFALLPEYVRQIPIILCTGMSIEQAAAEFVDQCVLIAACAKYYASPPMVDILDRFFVKKQRSSMLGQVRNLAASWNKKDMITRRLNNWQQ